MGFQETYPAEHRCLRKMKLARRFEERVYVEFTKPGIKIGGFAHLATGQEAIAVGVAEVFQKGKDFLIANVRHHAHSLALGMDPASAMAELFGKESGCCRGKGGSMHFFNAAVGDLGGILRAGGQLPLGIGAAFSCAYRKTGGVCFIHFGDGTMTTGAFSESMNLASLLKLPAVFILENNGVTIGTKVERANADPDLLRRGGGYAMPAHRVDGNDIEALIEVVYKAAERARQGNGPSYIVAETYRFRGHSMSDAMKYRSKGEIETARKRDPITLYENRLQQRGLIDASDIDRMEIDVNLDIENAMDIADSCSNAPIEARFDHVTSMQYPWLPEKTSHSSR